MADFSIFNIQSSEDFEKSALQIFRHQYIANKVYQRFCNLLGVSKNSVHNTSEIPYLPIAFFKTHDVVAVSEYKKAAVFTSSGTTGSVVSKHIVTDIATYESSFKKTFKLFYQAPQEYVILALLPSYLERSGSSLIYMVDTLIRQSRFAESGFYLNNHETLSCHLKKLDQEGKKIILIGVSFALLDLVESQSFQLNNTIIIETGGMKGRRKEVTREELNKRLKKGFGVTTIHSEYGMTELLSQAYATNQEGRFQCPPWMKIAIRDTEDALSAQQYGKTGGINIIDLANFNSCSFIATQDLGKSHEDNTFEVLGRFDHSDIRGCNLLAL